MMPQPGSEKEDQGNPPKGQGKWQRDPVDQLHVRRSLDQYCYHALKSTKDRDKDKLVSRMFENGDLTGKPVLIMVDINAKDSHGQMPLWWAAKNGDEAVVRLLLEWGAHTEAPDKMDGRTPLSRAATPSHPPPASEPRLFALLSLAGGAYWILLK
ncbi:hypothetical protein B0J13DRAFT_239012 [Dactylonectria estremocensis]|uniref:Uncharacterized protein n=1 Tax=Dactylonectria estremocensis TaxID=1079267 RepID=A0A9P9D9B6_9HYPO|nr:hypothetical protein B0J13DRAFT_239012 [Dactylonectria estremocensis]